MKKISPTVSDLFSPVHEWEEHLRVNPILKFRVAEGHEKFQRVHKQIFFSRMNRRKKKSRTLLGEIFFSRMKRRKKKSRTLLGEIFFTKIETIILTDCFFKFSGVFRVNDHRKTQKYKKMIFLLHSVRENIFFTVKKIFSLTEWRKKSKCF